MSERETIGFASLAILPTSSADAAPELVMRRNSDKVESGRVGNPLELRRAAAMLLRAADAMETEAGDCEDGIRTLVFRCDGLDACAIEAAVKVRANYAIPILPEYDGDEDAATLAEACRAYLDEYDETDACREAIKAAGLDKDSEEAAR